MTGSSAAQAAVDRVGRRLGHDFADPALLCQALTHRSRGRHNNERLEFLGDAVLGFVVADALYREHGRLPESRLTLARAALVRGETLAEVATELDLGSALQLGEGAARSGGHRRKSILADAVEALIGAVYLDAGEPAARALVLRLLGDRLANVVQDSEAMKDPKTRLQERLQAAGDPRPEYLLQGTSGRDHKLRFAVLCRVAGGEQRPGLEVLADGGSRRAAEKAAAAAALAALFPEESTHG